MESFLPVLLQCAHHEATWSIRCSYGWPESWLCHTRSARVANGSFFLTNTCSPSFTESCAESGAVKSLPTCKPQEYSWARNTNISGFWFAMVFFFYCSAIRNRESMVLVAQPFLCSVEHLQYIYTYTYIYIYIHFLTSTPPLKRMRHALCSMTMMYEFKSGGVHEPMQNLSEHNSHKQST